MRPSSTASIAFSASGLVFTNHCVETAVRPRSAALALADAELVVLNLFEQAERLQVCDNALARFEAVESGVRARGFGHHAFAVDDLDFRQIVPLAGFEIVRIVRGRHLHDAGAELRIGERIENDRNLAIHQRQDDGLAVQVGVAFVEFG